ncbi:1,4-beta-xylanase [Mycobacterium sp. NPDC003449]
MARRSALKLPLLAAAAMTLPQIPRAGAAQSGRWSADRVRRWYDAQGWLVGANYIPANAVNQLEMFQAETFDLQRIDTELRIARLMGFNTLRVFLHDQLWIHDRLGFQNRLALFVGFAASHGIKPLLVLFDSCWDPLPKLGPQRPPRPGVHNSRWVQSPGAERLDDNRQIRRELRDYVVGVLTQFRDDDRILGWDLWNEPDNPASVYRNVEREDKVERVADLLPEVFQWARSVDPIQPLTSAVWEGEWADPGRRTEIASIQLANSDVITFHSYANPRDFEARIAELAPLGRPIMCTEYLARTEGSTIEGILPVARRHNVGAYCWGLVAGKTQTYLPWDSWEHPSPEPPKVWFHDLYHGDGRPFHGTELQTVRDLTGRVYPP